MLLFTRCFLLGKRAFLNMKRVRSWKVFLGAPDTSMILCPLHTSLRWAPPLISDFTTNSDELEECPERKVGKGTCYTISPHKMMAPPATTVWNLQCCNAAAMQLTHCELSELTTHSFSNNSSTNSTQWVKEPLSSFIYITWAIWQRSIVCELFVKDDKWMQLKDGT